MSPSDNLVKVSWPASGVALGTHQVTINSPSNRNALSHTLIKQLCATLGDVDRDNATSAIVLAGNHGPPACFSAGLDVTELATLSSDQVMQSLDLLVSTLEKGISAPLIAAVGGVAIGGGCELALASDIVYASNDARFALPEVQLGLLAAGGGIRRLPEAVGMGKATELLLTGRSWSGIEAVRWGMAAESFATWEDCLKGAISCAEAIAGNSVDATRATMKLVRAGRENTSAERLNVERQEFRNLLDGQEHVRRRTAWLNRKG